MVASRYTLAVLHSSLNLATRVGLLTYVNVADTQVELSGSFGSLGDSLNCNLTMEPCIKALSRSFSIASAALGKFALKGCFRFFALLSSRLDLVDYVHLVR